MKRLFLLLGLLLSMVACAQKNISPQEFHEMITKDPNLQVVDVRTPQEFAAGHIKGARNVDFRNPDFEKNIAKAVKKRKTVLVYCRSGKRSLNAMNLMVKNGFKDVYNMEGGILAWEKEFEVEK
ncbi:MAG: rhodanese-like domain-containing protein [Paludibacteraceae bacterium]|nr:rhodanese-like domain-containing protein [Paludibacteraceae bacterium]MBP5480547.1 rhodanese-like domain-containing protein [Paludibacteraceae bacterium]